MSKKFHYKKIGRTQAGEPIYRDLETGRLCVEKNYERLALATAEDLENAEFEREEP